MKRAPIIALVTLLLCAPLWVWAQQFAIVADSHVGARDSVYGETIKRIETEKIETIIHLGDAINSPGSARQWKEFLELTGPGKTLHLAPGNNDIRDPKSVQVYLKFFSEMYYSFSEGDTLFIMLNTELPGEEHRIIGNQLNWLSRELEKPFRHKFVFLHQPLYPIVRLHALDLHEEPRNKLHKLLAENKVSLVVAGHEHAYRRSVKDGVTYVIAPRSRLVSYLFFDDGQPGYIVARRNGKGYSFTVKDNQGGIQDSFTITK
jgi:predicted phosphodiesterase